jgi:hypothetical protein
LNFFIFLFFSLIFINLEVNIVVAFFVYVKFQNLLH